MAANGYSTIGDLSVTTDGKPWNDIWAEFQATLQLVNTQRTAIVNLFTSNTVDASLWIEQSTTGTEFEEASEFGVPKSTRVSPSVVQMGLPLRWWDVRKGWTWRFLAEAQSSQLEAIHASVLEGDNRLVFKHVLRALLTKTTIATRPVNENNVPVYSLWDGETDATPPAYAGKSFTAGHNHYAATDGDLTGAHLDALIRNVTEHGYGADSGSQIVILAHPDDADVISKFRAGTSAAHDFIPADNAPAFLSSEQIIGSRAPGSYEGLKVAGSYGEAYIVTSNWVPKGYVTAVSTGGTAAPLAFREHTVTNLRGLQLIAGDNNAYPLQNSYYVRAFGVGVQHRGAAAVLQITADGTSTYTSPVIT